jgi:hypothetical protein
VVGGSQVGTEQRAVYCTRLRGLAESRLLGLYLYCKGHEGV